MMHTLISNINNTIKYVSSESAAFRKLRPQAAASECSEDTT